MAANVLMPKLSDTMDSGVILKWIKKEGDAVEPGDVLAEVSTDKADMEMEAYASGILKKILVPEGETVKVGGLLAIIAEEGEEVPAVPEARAPEEKEALRPAGAGARKEAPKAPAAAKPDAVAQPVQTAESQPPGDGQRVKASPLARKIAADKGIDLSRVRGSGTGGRIIERDLEKAPAARPSAPAPAAAVPAAPGEYREEPLNLMRKTIARRMTESKTTVPHFYLTMEIDMEGAVQLRKSVNTLNPESKVSFNDLVVRAVALALRRHPRVNASYRGEKVRWNEAVDVGVAVALEDGLITPILRRCDEKNLGEIAAAMQDLSERARKKRLKPEEYQGGTFTVSNLGMYEIENFSAIINPPEGGILAVGAVLRKPVVWEGEITARHRMKVTLSCDHRVVDGASGALFLQELKKLLENPVSLLM